MKYSGAKQRQDTFAALVAGVVWFLGFNVVAEDRAGLFRSLDRGVSWEALSDDLLTGVQGSFLVEFTDELVFATDDAGLFMSDDDRRRWRSVGDTLPGKKINALFAQDNEVWVAVYQHGLFGSSGTLRSWEAVDPQPPDVRIHAALLVKNGLLVGSDSGIYQKINGEHRWFHRLAGDQVVSLGRVDGRVVAGTTSGVTISEDHGQTWRWVHRQGALHTTAVVDGLIFAMYISGDLFLSRDQGTTWLEADYSPSHGSYVYGIARVGDVLLLSNNYGVHRSMDGGMSWRLVYAQEQFGFFGLHTVNQTVYGAARDWKERRERSGPFDLQFCR